MRSTHGLRSLLAAAALLAACSGPRQEPPRAVTPADELGRAFSFVEAVDDGTFRSIDPLRQLGQLDYKSRLTITPDAELLREIAGSAADVLPPLSDEEVARLELLRNVAELVQQLASLTVDLQRELARATPPEGDEITALVKREQLLRLRILEQLAAGVRADVAREFDPAAKEFDAAKAARGEAYRRDEQGRPVAINSRRFQELLDDRVRELAQTLRRDRTRLDDVATSLRLRAVLHSDGKRIPVHVENYDSIDLNWNAKEPRVGFGSSEDQERLRRESETMGALLRLRELETGDPLDARALVDTAGGALRADRQRIHDAVREVRVNAGEGGLPGLIVLARTGANAADQASLDALAAYVAALDAVADAIDAARRLGVTAGARGVRNDDVAALVEQIALLVERARLLDPVETTRILGERLKARRADLVVTGADFDATLAAALEELRGALDLALRGPESAEGQRALDRLDLLVAAMRARELLLPVAGAAAAIDARIIPRPMHELVSGDIDLNATIADRGDQLEVIAELLRRNGDEEEVFPSARRTFAVDRFRLVNSLSADVAFVRQSSEDHFRPAPAAAWTIHYRLPDEPDDTLGIDLLQLCDPGIGLSVHALSSDDESFQAGVGPHVSIFRDILRAGWGYNLSADSNRGYVFISIGIFEAINGIGTLMTGRFGGAGSGSGK